ncbi:ABC transporter ATP-binding protein [Pseudorhodoplanes sp.]|uniref:ABC transporter ATP-binding protein n=1 Tax=Pseudorhodoplanes sp. TaxID=1934341 RepID=UPI003D0C7F35
MTAPLLATKALRKRFGGLIATDSLDFEVMPGELHAVIGPNGAGKTTLVRQLIGETIPDSGRILFGGEDITTMQSYRRALLGMARSYQVTSILTEFTALQNVAIAAQAHAGHSFGCWNPVDSEEDLNAPALQALRDTGLAGKADWPAEELAHGERRQLEIAMALVSKPKILLLDEPMAGMGRHESEAIIQLLAGLKRQYTIVLIEHDMDAVFALADRITVLVYGRQIAIGSPEEIKASAEVRRAYLGDRYAAS